MSMTVILAALGYIAGALIVTWALLRHSARLREDATGLLRRLAKLEGTLADTRRNGSPDLAQLEGRMVRLEQLGASLPATWEDWYEKIQSAASRRERAAQRAERAARDAEDAEDVDAPDVGGAPVGPDGAPWGVQPVPQEMGSDPGMARSAYLRARAREMRGY